MAGSTVRGTRTAVVEADLGRLLAEFNVLVTDWRALMVKLDADTGLDDDDYVSTLDNADKIAYEEGTEF